ncbi:MAG: peptide chain release factor H [Aestuariibacter sp.]
MILLQLSAGQGPEECTKAVALAYKTLFKEAENATVDVSVLELEESQQPGCFKSVLLKLEGKNAPKVAANWNGIMQWICPSPFRPTHKRKNWFFSGRIFAESSELENANGKDNICFKTCRASGAGGQHVNATDSAVQATHVASGISVRVESERSQHANKRLARILIMHKLKDLNAKNEAKHDKNRWTQHWDLERGNPIRVFKGTSFKYA